MFPRWVADRAVEVTIQSPLDRVREPYIHLVIHQQNQKNILSKPDKWNGYHYSCYSWCFKTPLRLVQAELNQKSSLVWWPGDGATAAGHSVLQIDTAKQNHNIMFIELKSKTFIGLRYHQKLMQCLGYKSSLQMAQGGMNLPVVS